MKACITLAFDSATTASDAWRGGFNHLEKGRNDLKEIRQTLSTETIFLTYRTETPHLVGSPFTSTLN